MGLNYILKTLVLLVAVGFTLPAQALDSLRLEKEQGGYFVIHRVEKGETLYSLSRRYGADVQEVSALNGIVDNQISLDQELRFPIGGQDEESNEPSQNQTKTHVVTTGETLYAISRKYGVAVADLRKWNSLTGNEIAIGQELQITVDSKEKKKSDTIEEREGVAEQQVPEPEIPAGFTEYYVQSGDLLESIASKFKVRPDSIVIWNDLPNTYLSIGQKLIIRGVEDSTREVPSEKVESLPYGNRRSVKDQSGFIKIYEEGTARKIEDVVETEKYLALHRTLSVGTLIEIRNLMNNQKIFARVVGKLPPTGLNENVLIRLTPICFERLGVIDPKTRVEVSYYQD